jgi:hypothetical protein
LGQLKKLKAFISCQEKEVTHSLSLISMLIAASAIVLLSLINLISNLSCYFMDYLFPLQLVLYILYLKMG